jgi:hypothetical protein
MKETANDMWSQWNTVNGAFEQRVYETNEAKEKIQNHLNAVNKIMYPLIEKTHSLSLSLIIGYSRNIRFGEKY